MDNKKLLIVGALLLAGFIIYKTVVMKKTTGTVGETVLQTNNNVVSGTEYTDNNDPVNTVKTTDEKVTTVVDEATALEVYNEKAGQSDVYFSTPDNATLYEFISKFGTVDKKSATSKRQAKKFKMIAQLKGYVNGYLIKTRVFEDTNAVLKKNKYWIEFGGEYRRLVITDKTKLQNYIVK